MRRSLDGGFELDDDRDRVDVDVVHRFLSEESYWAAGRPRQTVERLVRESRRVVGLYERDHLIGFCRVVSDDEDIAWLGDGFGPPIAERAMYRRRRGYLEPGARRDSGAAPVAPAS